MAVYTEKLTTPVADASTINELLRRYGVKFGIYKNGQFKEQLFPFALSPVLLPQRISTGLKRGLSSVWMH